MNKVEIKFEPAGLDSKSKDLIRSTIEAHLTTPTSYRVFVFGSRASGKHRPYSDLDLWIESTPALTSSAIETLRAALEDSDLAVKVDIVTPETCLDEFLVSIGAQKQLWFEAK